MLVCSYVRLHEGPFFNPRTFLNPGLCLHACTPTPNFCPLKFGIFLKTNMLETLYSNILWSLEICCDLFVIFSNRKRHPLNNGTDLSKFQLWALTWNHFVKKRMMSVSRLQLKGLVFLIFFWIVLSSVRKMICFWLDLNWI